MTPHMRTMHDLMLERIAEQQIRHLLAQSGLLPQRELCIDICDSQDPP